MFTTRPTLQGTFGMVSSTHWLASQSAMAVLEDGGNAYDAAVAGGLRAARRRTAPQRARRRGADHPRAGRTARCGCCAGRARHPPGPRIDALPVARPRPRPRHRDRWPPPCPAPSTPGCCCCATTAPRPVADVLKYAIGYAEDGHAPVERDRRDRRDRTASCSRRSGPRPPSVYLPGGRPPRARRAVPQPGARRHLAAADRRGRRGGGTGVAADRGRAGGLARGLRRRGARRARPRGPPWTPAASATPAPSPPPTSPAWSATYEAPATYDWNGWTLVQGRPAGARAPPSSSSSPLLAAGAARVRLRRRTSTCSSRAASSPWRTGRPGTATRADVPLDELLSDAYNADRRASSATRPRTSCAPAAPGGRAPRLSAHAAGGRRRRASAARRGAADAGRRRADRRPTRRRDTGGDTCHLDVVDRWGNMVAATPSGGWLQSNPVVPELGFPLGTRLQMAWLEEGLPNSLTPGRRPAHHPHPLARAARRRAGDGLRYARRRPAGPVAAALLPRRRAAPAGARRLDLQGAIDAPNWHNDSFPGSFYPRGMRPGSVTVESRIAAGGRRRSCAGAATTSTVGDAWSEGRLCAVARDPETGVLSAAANPRGMQGYAVGR